MTHADPLAHIVLALAILLIVGKAAGAVAVRLGQPAVLGELGVGILLGNAGLATIGAIKTDPIIDALGNLGVLILLFEVGVASTVDEMRRVGASAFGVATLGVVAPFALGWAVGAWLLPDAGRYVHAFLGATLCATSVGITARVLRDLGASKRIESRIILGAAVVDDVLGLIVLGVVSGAIVGASSGAALSWLAVMAIAMKAAAFLVAGILLGRTLAPRVFAAAARVETTGVLLTLSLGFCFAMSWLATVAGLSPIIGAFTAGLVLEDAHFRPFAERGERSVEDLLRPLADFLVPVFFVLMGLRTDLGALLVPGTLGLTVALIAAAIVGKQLCSLGVMAPGVNRLAIGVGMIPRGEVGLIFANVGLSLTLNGAPVMSRGVFSAVVAMVFVTTLITPPALKWSLRRRHGNRLTRPAA